MTVEQAQEELMTSGVQLVPVDRLRSHPKNPRRALGELRELTASIAQQGVLQNLTVVPHEGRAGGWTVVIGHRRLAAAKRAGLTEVPCVVAHMTAADQVATMLAENLHRADLSAMEEAQGYQDALDLGCTVEDLVQRTGRAKKTVRSRLRLLGLPEPARRAVHSGQATLEDAALVAAIKDTDEREIAAGAMGTTNLRAVVAQIERDRELAVQKASLVAQAVAAGIDQVDAVPPGYRFVETCYSFSTSLDRYHRALAQAGDGWVFRTGDRWVELYRPPTAEELRDQQQVADEREQRQAELAEANREQHERQERDQLFARLRREFIQGTSRSLTQLGATAVVEHVARDLLTDLWRDIVPPVDYDVLTQVLGMPTDLDDDAATQWVQDASARLSGPACLLAYAECAVGTRVEPSVRWQQWYELLETLGYEMSDAEADVVFGPHQASDGCAACESIEPADG